MDNLTQIRPFIFLTLLALMLFAQYLRPAYKYHKNLGRIGVNTVLFILSIITMKVAFPFGLYQFAEKIATKDLSLLKIAQLPQALSVVLTILIFDFIIYWQHRIFHVFNILWRAHEVHHADTQMDVTTALRFHPIEIILSGFIKMLAISILGPLAWAYLLYEILLNGFALFTHTNMVIPKKIDSFLRWFIVTPAMHFPHHSPDRKLMNSNYGNILSLWDRFFKSYTDAGTDIFGVSYIPENKAKDIKFSLLEPFTNNRLGSNHNPDSET